VIYERYDDDHNSFSRIQKMVAEMKRINSMPDDEKTEVLDRLTAIANENKVLYNTLYANSKI
jgi:flagellar motor switch protein FliG